MAVFSFPVIMLKGGSSATVSLRQTDVASWIVTNLLLQAFCSFNFIGTQERGRLNRFNICEENRWLMTEGRYPILARKHRQKSCSRLYHRLSMNVHFHWNYRALASQRFTAVTHSNISCNSPAKHTTQMTYMVGPVWRNNQTFSLPVAGGIL